MNQYFFLFLYKDSRKVFCPLYAPFYKISSEIVDIYKIVINYNTKKAKVLICIKLVQTVSVTTFVKLLYKTSN